MKRKARQNQLTRTRGAALAALLACLSLGPALWPTTVPAQTAVDEAPVIRGKDGSLRSEGFLFRPSDGVDVSDWSKDKTVRVTFKLEREGRQEFIESVREIKAELNGENVPLAQDSLKPGNEPVKILFMIDRSGSMDMGGNGVRKLQAAKDSLRHFVESLSPNEQAAIYAFDERQDLYVSLTNDKEALKRGIRQIEVSDTNSRRHTSLYESINTALDEAKSIGVQHIILLTDGKEDMQWSRAAFNEGRLSQVKAEREEALGQKARRYGVRVHTIALGDPAIPVEYSKDKRSEEAVDRVTLEHISAQSNNGLARFIDIPKLNEQTGSTANEFMTERLNDVLTEIKKRAEFNYVQTVVVPDLPEGVGSFLLTVIVEKDRKYIPFTAEYQVAWTQGKGDPIFILWQVGRLGLINPKPPIEWSGLARIYLTLFLPLALLALFPAAYSRIAAERAMRRMSRAIEVVGRHSPLQGKQCPNEMGAAGLRYLFREGDTVLVCPMCNTPHHLNCWEYNQHSCMNRVCEYRFPLPERLLDKYRLTPETKKRFV